MNSSTISTDFTFDSYANLLLALRKTGYSFLSLESYLNNKKTKYIVLRHDVDRKPGQALEMAKIEKELGIQASYYFRIVAESYNEPLIQEIAKLDHEIGYHYEELSLFNGDFELALKAFKANLNKMRQFYPVKTFCMHGSPMSRWDNRLLWQMNDYKKFGLEIEPYFDLDFNEVFYITDASRGWNNAKVTLRDKVESNFDFGIKSMQNILELAQRNELPPKIMLNIHPHLWADNFLLWLKIYLWQNFKNVIKRMMIH